MASKTLTSHLTTLLLFLLHLGCFLFSNPNPTRIRKTRKSPAKLASSSWSFLKRIFTKHVPSTRPSSPSSQLSVAPIIPLDARSRSESELSDNPFFPLRNDIFPCTSCGEIFLRPHLLEQHQLAQHAVSELRDGDPGKNVIWIIFKTGWAEKKTPIVHRILKIHHRSKTLDRFEEFREIVKARAAIGNDAVWRRNERCLADGNELLRFYCTTFVCSLGQDGNSALCGHQYCSMCGIIRSGFSAKLDGISTLATSWKAHTSVPDDVETEFSFMSVKRAMLVCRVIAGRVGYGYDPVVADKGDPGFDSVASCGGIIGGGFGKTNANAKSDDDEIVVFNPRAVLPCFVIVYSV